MLGPGCFDMVKIAPAPLETLVELKQVVELAIGCIELGEKSMRIMTDREIYERKAQFGDCDMILGNFKITRI